MKKKISLLLIIIVIFQLTLSACGSTDAKEVISEDDPFAYAKYLEDNHYYIRHNDDNSCEAPYWPKKIFDTDVPSSHKDNRIIWLTEESFNKIPTLYKGDSLIYKNGEKLVEEFKYERFEDLGFSVGLALLSVSNSGRLLINTNPDKNNTCPGADTDILINEFKDTEVLIDKIGGKDIRAEKYDKNWNTEEILTRAGTIKGLEKDNQYEFITYVGTYRHDYIFKADKRVFSSMEVCKTNAFSFESDVLIEITLPDNMQSGYYSVNGSGLFRYVNETNELYKTNPDNLTLLDYNVLNGWELDNIAITDPDNPDNPNGEITPINEGDISEDIFISLMEELTIRVDLINSSNPYIVEGIIVTPSNEEYTMTNLSSLGRLELKFYPPETGMYKVILKYLDGAQYEIKTILSSEEE